MTVAVRVIPCLDVDDGRVVKGVNFRALRDALERSVHPVVASGGVRSPSDLEALAALRSGDRRLTGAIVGTALVEGVMSVEEAIAACVLSV